MGRQVVLGCLVVGVFAGWVGCLQSPAPSDPVEPSADAGPECTEPADCPVGQQCINNACTRPPSCETQEDCPEDLRCVRGGCYTDEQQVPPADGGTEGADGGDTFDPNLDVEAPDAPDIESDTSVGADADDASQPTTEQNCKDGIDNDGNGERDCNDPACIGEVCSDDGKMCLLGSRGRCACPDTGDEETNCDDGIDNDCDGKIDCADVDCAKRDCDPDHPKKRCEYVSESCEFPDGEANCSGDSYCCGDGVDNDGDGDVDCEDSDCHGEQCGSEKWCRRSSMNADYECQ